MDNLKKEKMRGNINFRFMAFALFSLFMLGLALQTHIYGIPSTTYMDDYFIKNSQKETAANNVVTAIVFDYRGLDTLGEATIMFSAILGVAMLFRKEKVREGWDQDA